MSVKIITLLLSIAFIKSQDYNLDDTVFSGYVVYLDPQLKGKTEELMSFKPTNEQKWFFTTPKSFKSKISWDKANRTVKVKFDANTPNHLTIIKENLNLASQSKPLHINIKEDQRVLLVNGQKDWTLNENDKLNDIEFKIPQQDDTAFKVQYAHTYQNAHFASVRIQLEKVYDDSKVDNVLRRGQTYIRGTWSFAKDDGIEHYDEFVAFLKELGLHVENTLDELHKVSAYEEKRLRDKDLEDAKRFKDDDDDEEKNRIRKSSKRFNKKSQKKQRKQRKSRKQRRSHRLSRRNLRKERQN